MDGVGFSENKKDTINKMIEEFDVFLQIKTLYKIGLFLHKLKIIKLKGIVFSEEYEQKDSDEMFKKYGSSDIKIFTKKESANQNMVQAGFANLIL